MQPELLTMNWVLFDPPSHKIGHAQGTSSSDGSGIYIIRTKQALKAQVSDMKKWPKCPCHSCYTIFSLPACTYGLWGVPYDQLADEEKTWAWFSDDCAQYAGTAPDRKSVV